MSVYPSQYDCFEISDLLFDYTDQNLTQDVRLAMQLHFMTCTACNQKLEEYRATVETARTILRERAPQVPQCFYEEVITSLEAEPAPEG